MYPARFFVVPPSGYSPSVSSLYRLKCLYYHARLELTANLQSLYYQESLSIIAKITFFSSQSQFFLFFTDQFKTPTIWNFNSH